MYICAHLNSQMKYYMKKCLRKNCNESYGRGRIELAKLVPYNMRRTSYPNFKESLETVYGGKPSSDYSDMFSKKPRYCCQVTIFLF